MKKNGFTLVQIAIALAVLGSAFGVAFHLTDRAHEDELRAKGKDPKKTYISERLHVYVDHETGCEYLSLALSGPLVSRLGSDGRPLCRRQEWFK